MKTNASLELKNSFGDAILLDLQRDIVEIDKFIKQTFKTITRFPVFQEIEARICADCLEKSTARLLTPTHDINRLYLVVFYSTITDLRKPDKIYFKWEYRHHDGITYTAKEYTDIEAMIKMDNLLTS